MRLLKATGIGVLALSLGGAFWAVAQRVPTDAPEETPSKPIDMNDPDFGNLYMSSRLGSFKMRTFRGRFEISFSGTALLSHYEGAPLIVEGNLQKEYDANNKVAYFGRGKIVGLGTLRALQWFGRDLEASWRGTGVAQLYGEFDEKLETGKYWFDDPTDQRHWGTFGMTVTVPRDDVYGSGTPVPRSRAGSGGGGTSNAPQ